MRHYPLANASATELARLRTQRKVEDELEGYKYYTCDHCGSRDIHDQGGMFYANYRCYECGRVTLES